MAKLYKIIFAIEIGHRAYSAFRLMLTDSARYFSTAISHNAHLAKRGIFSIMLMSIYIISMYMLINWLI